MDSENWPQIKEILEVAIEQPPDRRTQFIRERCSGDVALQSKVESLIDSFDRIGDFMEDGAIGSVADTFASSRNGFEPGDSIGKYQIIRLLGEGGMGTVYLADDPGLHRQVAIKVLRDDLWWYKQGRQRLLREARAAAKLDHPNICSIYEVDDTDERSFIVMQHVEGRTLGEVMANGGLGGNRCLNVALQIAAALDEAHSHHLIHRDIKPANIIISEKGHVKVLDFGLAKSIKPTDEKPDDLSSSGAVMGTVPYMSPEQLRGKTIDGRSDIFSFGALLFEMVSGHQAFGEDNNAETISAILNTQPNFSLLPRKFRPVVQKAMQKKAADRYQTISELSDDLRVLVDDTAKDTDPEYSFTNWFGARNVISTAFRRYLSGRTPRSNTGRSYYRWQDSDSDARTVPLTQPILSEPVTERQPVQPNARPYLLGGLAVLVLASIPAIYMWSTKVQRDLHAFDSLKTVELVSWKDAGSNVYTGYSSSHNGKMIAYSSRQEGPNDAIFVKPVSGGDPVPVTKDGWKNYSPIWSPDDQQIAFISIREGIKGIYLTPFSGGATTLIKSLDPGTSSLTHWTNGSSAIFYEFKGNLFRLDLTSKEPEQLTSFEPSDLSVRHFALSPDEKHTVYRDQANGQTDLWLAAVDGRNARRLTNDPDAEINAAWHPDGKRIFYSVTRDKHTQINVAYVNGEASEQITRGEGEHQLVDVSGDGKNIFYTTWQESSDIWQVNVENGNESQVAASKESEFWPDISPDGKLILYQINSAPNPISVLEESSIVISSLGGADGKKIFAGYDARWLADGRHIAFLRWQDFDKRNSLWIADTVTNSERNVVDEGVVSPDFTALPYDRRYSRDFSASPDGSKVVFASVTSHLSNISTKAIGDREAVSLTQNTDLATTFVSPMFSPDGNRVAYVSVQRPLEPGAKKVSRVWIEENGGKREILSGSETIRLLGWNGNDTLMLESSEGILRSEPGNFRLVALSLSGQTRLISEVESASAFSAVLSPDGKMLALAARSNQMDDVYTIATGGGGTIRKVTANNDPRLYYGSLAWSQDGKHVFFDKQERVNTISMLEGLR